MVGTLFILLWSPSQLLPRCFYFVHAQSAPSTSALSLPLELRSTSRPCDFPNLAPSPSSSTVASSARFLGPWQLYLIPCDAQSLPLFFSPHKRQCRQGASPSTSLLTVGVRIREGDFSFNFWNRLIGLVPFFSLPSGRRWYIVPNFLFTLRGCAAGLTLLLVCAHFFSPTRTWPCRGVGA